MRGFDLLEFAHHLVVLDVGDGRLVEYVIAIIRLVDAAANLLGASRGMVRIGRFSGHCVGRTRRLAQGVMARLRSLPARPGRALADDRRRVQMIRAQTVAALSATTR